MKKFFPSAAKMGLVATISIVIPFIVTIMEMFILPLASKLITGNIYVSLAIFLAQIIFKVYARLERNKMDKIFLTVFGGFKEEYTRCILNTLYLVSITVTFIVLVVLSVM